MYTLIQLFRNWYFYLVNTTSCQEMSSHGNAEVAENAVVYLPGFWWRCYRQLKKTEEKTLSMGAIYKLRRRVVVAVMKWRSRVKYSSADLDSHPSHLVADCVEWFLLLDKLSCLCSKHHTHWVWVCWVNFWCSRTERGSVDDVNSHTRLGLKRKYKLLLTAGFGTRVIQNASIQS